MHELSIAYSLFDMLEQHVREQKASKVVAVKVRVGKMSGIEPELLQFAFDNFQKGTVAENARLTLNVAEIVIKCQRCQQQTQLAEFVFLCPQCQGSDVQIVAGKELLLESVELEI